MAVGYSGRPLYAKLGWKDGGVLCVSGAPTGFVDWLGGMPGEIVSEFGAGFGLGICFVLTIEELERVIRDVVPRLASNGSLWMSWPKKSSKLAGEVDFETVQGRLIAAGLVDVKVCAVSEDFSGLKFMVPVKDRAAWGRYDLNNSKSALYE
ncbi:MAG: DUF3052 domain-containing protein [Fimbriimonadaceae bacterium]